MVYIFLRRQLIVDFQTYFKDSLCLEKFYNLGVKGVKSSVKMWTTNFFRSFSKKYFVVHEQSAVENSLSTYVCYTPDGLFWLNLQAQIFDYINQKVLFHKTHTTFLFIDSFLKQSD